MKCPYCRGFKTLESALHGVVACRVCLGTGKVPEEPYDLGHDVEGRVLRRIAQLLPFEQFVAEIAADDWYSYGADRTDVQTEARKLLEATPLPAGGVERG